MGRCRDCRCCEDTTGRLLGVAERIAGSALASDFIAPGVYGLLTGQGDGDGMDPETLTMTVTQDQVGDGVVIIGGNGAGPVPTGVTDSKGNTYYTGDSIHGTMGLDGTVWIVRGDTDGGKLLAGDTITITGFDDGLGDTNPESARAVAFDVAGVQGTQAAIEDHDSRSFGFAFSGDGFSLSTGTLAQDNELLFAIAYNHELGATISGAAPLVHYVFDLFEVMAGLVPTTTYPGIIGFPPHLKWGEGLAFAYRTGVGGQDTLTLVDASAFDEDGGSGQLLDPETGDADVFTYTGIDDDTDTLLGVAGVTGFYPVGAVVEALPLSTIRYADLQIDGEDDLIQARIPHYLYDRIPILTRDVNASEAYSVLCRLQVDGWIVTDVYGETPIVDGSFIDPTTLPRPSDGHAPGSSPTPDVVPGDDHLKVRWAPVTLNDQGDPQLDPVHYDIHVTDSADEATATLDLGTGTGEWTLTAVTPGAAGNTITIEVVV